MGGPHIVPSHDKPNLTILSPVIIARKGTIAEANHQQSGKHTRKKRPVLHGSEAPFSIHL
jgi:hypothetical protein